MNKQQIIDAIETKIKGQGNRVDIAGVLPDILSSMLDLIPTSQDVLDSFTVKSNTPLDEINNGSGLTKQEAAERLGITEDELDNIFNGKYLVFVADTYRLGFVEAMDADDKEFAFGTSGIAGSITIARDDSGKYAISANAL